MTNQDNATNTPSAGTLRWWDLNFEEQEMEDMYRLICYLDVMIQFRWMAMMGLLIVIGYQYLLMNSRAEIEWTLVRFFIYVVIFSFSLFCCHLIARL